MMMIVSRERPVHDDQFETSTVANGYRVVEMQHLKDPTVHLNNPTAEVQTMSMELLQFYTSLSTQRQ
jgi:hypothetical protein